MTLNKVLLITSGILHILLATFHALFFLIFNWGETLANVDPTNAVILKMLNYCFTIFLIWVAYVFLFRNKEILCTKLGQVMLVFLSVLYFARYIMEFTFPGGSFAFSFIILALVFLHLIPALRFSKQNQLS